MKFLTGFVLLCLSVAGVLAVSEEPVTSTASSSTGVTEPSSTSQSPTHTTKTTTSTTTQLPTTTTSTEAPPTTTTTVVTTETPTTVTEKPTEPPTTVIPTESPTPTVGNWSVTNEYGNVTCIKASMAVHIMVSHLGPYANESISHNLSPHAASDKSECGDKQLLYLEDGDYALALLFAQSKSENFVQNISLSFEKNEVRTISGKYFAANKDYSYICSKQENVVFLNVSLAFYNVHIEAFGGDNSTDFRKAQECAEDDKMNDVVPIAVACVLVGLVVIILIGYLIGRRQTRPRGYQSM